MKSYRDRVDDLINKGHSKCFSMDKALENYENSKYDMRCRIDKRVNAIIESENGIFYTLTLNNRYNDAMEHDKLEKKAKKWCKTYFDIYLGNRDYGENNGRIHWHILAIGKEQLPTQESWPYGNIDWIRFYNGKYKKIRNYILKMSSHSLKESASHIFRSQKQQ